jgi:predicted RNA-binding Zn ribbon-like protein
MLTQVMSNLELIRDFVNTADLEDGEDKLAETQGLQYWLVFHGLAELRHRATAADLEAAVELREAIRELLRAHNGIEVDLDASSATLDAAARRTGLSVRFEDGAIRFVPAGAGVARGLGLVLAAVGGAMADGSWRRLKACRSDTCRWAFIDNARNLSRQWCDMAVCGNRAKARAFRSRNA